MLPPNITLSGAATLTDDGGSLVLTLDMGALEMQHSHVHHKIFYQL